MQKLLCYDCTKLAPEGWTIEANHNYNIIRCEKCSKRKKLEYQKKRSNKWILIK